MKSQRKETTKHTFDKIATVVLIMAYTLIFFYLMFTGRLGGID